MSFYRSNGFQAKRTVSIIHNEFISACNDLLSHVLDNVEPLKCNEFSFDDDN